MAASRARRPAAPSPSRPDITRERDTLFAALRPVVAMLEPMVGPHIEVALHDLSRPSQSVVAIANGHLSHRTVGSSILSGPREDIAFAAAWQEAGRHGEARHSVIERYPTVTAEGRALQSATVIYRDSTGTPFAALCVNADMTHFQAAHTWLSRYLGAPTASPPTPAVPSATVANASEHMQAVAAEAVARLGKPVEAMRAPERQQAVETMMHRGLFAMRGGVKQAAAALQVSRFTVYNDINEIRARQR